MKEKKAETKEKKTLISVIIPVYKVEPYLEACVDSVLSQTYEMLEIILVDDGSPDKCGMICDAYAAQDSRVRVIHKENAGISSARNAGLDISTGEYITFVDSDDLLEPEACSRMLERIQETGADVCVGNFLYIDQWGNPHSEYFPEKQEIQVFGREEAFRRMTEALDMFFTVVWGKLYRKDVFREFRMEKGRIHEDTLLMHHLFGECKVIATIEESVYFYRIRPDSIMRSDYHIKRVEDGAEAYWDRYLYLREEGYGNYADCALKLMAAVVETGLKKLPLKGNEAVFGLYIKRLMLHYPGTRSLRILLLAVKNRLAFRRERL